MSDENKNFRYYYLKNRKKCVVCQRQDERTLSGKIRCKECDVIHRKRIQKYKAERKANGLCVYCGKPAVNGTVRCEKHRQDMIDYHNRRKQRTRKNWGGLNEYTSSENSLSDVH